MAKPSTRTAAISSGLADAARGFAETAHSGQRRKQTGEPFIEHPIRVAELLADGDFGEVMVAAGYLHDVVEKTDVDLGQIEDVFGGEVAVLVDALTEDPDLVEYGDRKRALRARVLRSGRTAAIIYAADRVANLRDWRRRPHADRARVAGQLGTELEERLQLWREDLGELTGFDPGLPFLEEIELQLRALAGPDGA